MTSRVGFFFFIGITLGAIAGYLTGTWPPQTALFGAIIGVALALVLDWRGQKRGDQEGDGKNED